MTQLVTVTVDAAPLGVAEGTPEEIDCILSMGGFTQTRASTEYACMSTDESYTTLGSITREALSFELLYSEVTTGGQQKLHDAFDTNEEVQVVIEFNNPATAGTGSGTILSGLFGVSKFELTIEKDAAIGANFELVFLGSPTLTVAT